MGYKAKCSMYILNIMCMCVCVCAHLPCYSCTIVVNIVFVLCCVDVLHTLGLVVFTTV